MGHCIYMSLPRSTITETGLSISALGLGTVKFGRNTGVKYPSAFELPSDKEILNLLNLAWDLGINLIDTAPAYGTSEQRLGKLLKQTGKDWIIATKAGETFDASDASSHYDFSPKALIASVYNSLKQLQRDQLDIVLIHSDGNDTDIIQQHRALDTLADLKQQGLIRAIGMSTKTVEGGLLALKQSDIVMVMHNAHYQAEQTVIEQAEQQGKAIFIKKALASGHLDNNDPDPVQTNFNAIYQFPAVASVIVGSLNPDHLKSNVKTQKHILS